MPVSPSPARLSLVMLLVLIACVVMTPACVSSPGSKPLPTDRDPVVETRVQVERVCPAELSEDIGQLPARPPGGVLEGDAATLGWVGAIARAAADLWQRLVDARAGCPMASGR